MKFDPYIFKIQKYSIHDGTGIRTTVFLKGCPLTCLWCHNPESQKAKSEIIVRQNRCKLCRTCVAICANNCIEVDSNIITLTRCPLLYRTYRSSISIISSVLLFSFSFAGSACLSGTRESVPGGNIIGS